MECKNTDEDGGMQIAFLGSQNISINGISIKTYAIISSIRKSGM